MLRRLATSSLSVVALLTLAAGAEAQFFKYPTNCTVTATGQLETNAFIGATAFVAFDNDTVDLGASFPITSSSSLSYGNSHNSTSQLSQFFSDLGCTTTASAFVSGQTTYSFSGTTSEMRLDINTISVNTASITRQLPALGPGGPVTAANEYQIPQVDSLLLETPFAVSGNATSTIKVSFDLLRQDTTITTGTMIGAWEVFEDTDGDCVLDPFEPQVGGAAGIVFPNTTFSMPSTSFQVKPGSYILRTQYFNEIELFQSSPSCSVSTAAGGFVTDAFTLFLKVG